VSDSQPLSLSSPEAQADERQGDRAGQLLGIIRPAQANAIRGTIRDMMAYHTRGSGSQSGAGVDNRLLDMLPGNAELMKLITPFLSADQVDQVAKGTMDGSSKT
jgi:hypothetical protein